MGRHALRGAGPLRKDDEGIAGGKGGRTGVDEVRAAVVGDVARRYDGRAQRKRIKELRLDEAVRVADHRHQNDDVDERGVRRTDEKPRLPEFFPTFYRKAQRTQGLHESDEKGKTHLNDAPGAEFSPSRGTDEEHEERTRCEAKEKPHQREGEKTETRCQYAPGVIQAPTYFCHNQPRSPSA